MFRVIKLFLLLHIIGVTFAFGFDASASLRWLKESIDSQVLQNDNNRLSLRSQAIKESVVALEQYQLSSTIDQYDIFEDEFLIYIEKADNRGDIYQTYGRYQEQKLYPHQSKLPSHLPKLKLAPAAIADIKVAVEAGFTVTTHEKRISVVNCILQ